MSRWDSTERKNAHHAIMVGPSINLSVHQLTCGDDHACHVAPAKGELHLVRARVGVRDHVRAGLQCEDLKLIPEATQHREREVFRCVLVADLKDTGRGAVLHVVVNHNQQKKQLAKLKFGTTLVKIEHLYVLISYCTLPRWQSDSQEHRAEACRRQSRSR